MDDKTFFNSAPKKRIACGVIFFNTKKEILIAKPTYKSGWTLPGGIVEKSESPLQGAKRETLEEIGLSRTPQKLLCIDHKYDAVKSDDSFQLIFFGGVLRVKEIKKIKLQREELSAYQFVNANRAATLLRPNIGNRTAHALRALEKKTVLYLENGKPVLL